MRPATKLIAALAGAGLVLSVAACGKAPDKGGDNGGSSAEFKGCMVTDTGGVDDKSFNTSAWQGMQGAAERDKGIKVDYVQSNSEADYPTNLQNYVDGDCNLIVAVGGLMAADLEKVAKANPDQAFAIVDAKIDLPNVYSMQFNTAQNSFLAGYLAASTTKTGTVATYGGLKIPPVTIFMDGFAEGVAHYNKTKGKDVKVLGWDPKAQNGSFAESFTDQQKGKNLTDTFVSQGADIIFPVAGGTGVGTTTVAQSNKSLSVIWVDVDGCKSLATACDVFLSTAEKNIPAAVTDAVVKARSGTKGGAFIGTLENQGVSLAAYQNKASMVTPEIDAEIKALRQDIIDGKVKIESAAQPATA